MLFTFTPEHGNSKIIQNTPNPKGIFEAPECFGMANEGIDDDELTKQHSPQNNLNIKKDGVNFLLACVLGYKLVCCWMLNWTEKNRYDDARYN